MKVIKFINISFLLIAFFILLNCESLDNENSVIKNRDINTNININSKQFNKTINKKNSIELTKVNRAYKKLLNDFKYEVDKYAIIVIISKQKLFLVKNNKIEKSFNISTSKYGIGNQINSNKTPLGTHEIYSKIGDGFPIGTVFKRKTYTGRKVEIYKDAEKRSSEDLVLTRILTLNGLEYGINKGTGVDSYYRGIFIHGTQEEGLIGTPASHGCIRMSNEDIIELFNLVKNRTLVEIIN